MPDLALFLSALFFFVHSRPGAAFYFFLRGTAFLVALFDVFGLSFLFVAVLSFASSCHKLVPFLVVTVLKATSDGTERGQARLADLALSQDNREDWWLSQKNYQQDYQQNQAQATAWIVAPPSTVRP